MSRSYKTYKYCNRCGVYYQIKSSRAGKYCPNCLPDMEPDLVIDIGDFHLEARTYAMPVKQIDRLISKACSYAKKMSSES